MNEAGEISIYNFMKTVVYRVGKEGRGGEKKSTEPGEEDKVQKGDPRKEMKRSQGHLNRTMRIKGLGEV